MARKEWIGIVSLATVIFAGCSGSPAAPAPAPSTSEISPAPVDEPAAQAPEEVPKPAEASAPAPKPKAQKTSPAVAPPVLQTPASKDQVPQTAANETADNNVPPAAVTPPAAPSNLAPTPAAPVAPPAPPQPTTRQVTIPTGTLVSVRMIDTVDSATAKVGETYHASLAFPLTVDRDTVAPKGGDVYVRLTHVESAGNLKGQSEVSLELDRILVGGKSYTVASDVYQKQAASQTQQTATRTGIGAGIGAVIGAIAGGKKGAAIGAGVGGGAGVAIEAAGKGEQVRIEPESVVDFRLQQPLEVTIDSRSSASTSGARNSSSTPRLTTPAPGTAPE